jgi:hypothetical protein
MDALLLRARASVRTDALDRDAVHLPTFAGIVVDGVVHGAAFQSDRRVSVVWLFSEPYCIALPERWQTAAQECLSVAELHGRRMIGFPSHRASGSTRALLRDFFHPAQGKVRRLPAGQDHAHGTGARCRRAVFLSRAAIPEHACPAWDQVLAVDEGCSPIYPWELPLLSIGRTRLPGLLSSSA